MACQSCWGRASTPSFYVSDVCLRGISNTLTTRLNERRPGGTQDVEIISHLKERLLQRRSRVSDSVDRTISKYHRESREISQSVSYFTVPPRAPPLCRIAEQTIKPDLHLYLPCSCPGKVERRKTEAACAVRRPLPHRLAPNQRGMRWYCVFLFLYGFAIQIKLTHSCFLGTRHTHSDAYTCACTPSSLQLSFDGSRVDSPPSARRSHRLFDSGPPIDPRTHPTRTPGFYGRYPRGPPVRCRPHRLFDSGRPSTPGHPPPAHQALR